MSCRLANLVYSWYLSSWLQPRWYSFFWTDLDTIVWLKVWKFWLFFWLNDWWWSQLSLEWLSLQESSKPCFFEQNWNQTAHAGFPPRRYFPDSPFQCLSIDTKRCIQPTWLSSLQRRQWLVLQATSRKQTCTCFSWPVFSQKAELRFLPRLGQTRAPVGLQRREGFPKPSSLPPQGTKVELL